MNNRSSALEGVLARHLAAHRRSQAEKSSATPLSDAPSKHPPKQSPKAAKQSQAKREERLAQYEQVVTLRKLGLSQTAIADQVGIGHATVSRWLGVRAFPEQQPHLRKTGLDSYLPFLRQRWERWLPYHRSVLAGTGGSWLYKVTSMSKGRGRS